MPIYEYRCSQCLHTFELRQDFDAETVTPCPKCQAEAHRRITAAGIIFKGAGFYATDHSSSHSGFRDKRDDGQPDKNGSEASSTSSTEDSSGSESSAASASAVTD